MSESIEVKVSVWRTFSPRLRLIMSADVMDEELSQSTIQELTEESSRLQEEVFSWQILEDPFSGIADQVKRENLKKSFFEKMDINIPPSERSVATLKSFIKEANVMLESGGVEWSGSKSLPVDDDKERHLNSLLALVSHLSWLINVFEGQPNISVSVR